MARQRADRSRKNLISVMETDAMSGQDQRTWWAGLGKGSRWAVIGAILFLGIGALGAGLKYLDESAQASKTNSARETSVLSSLNPFASAPLPDPTPQLSREYIYAGSRLLAVEDANANAAPPADLAIWRQSSGVWYVRNPENGVAWATPTWGVSTDRPVPGDYDGDGRTDFSIYRPDPNQTNNEKWYIILSANNVIESYAFGSTGDNEAQADYDGDGKTDSAVYRSTTGVWHIRASSIGYYTVSWGGQPGDKIASADYDGDGKADIAIWRPSNSSFYTISSITNTNTPIVSMGQSGEPVGADYDGDGKADYALYDDSTAYWYIRQSSNLNTISFQWGSPADAERAVHNDYDGDGKVDVAVWRNANGYWYIRQSASNNNLRTVGWGQPGDIPVPAFYRR